MPTDTIDSKIIEAMATPRYDFSDDVQFEMVSREGFAYILETALKSDDYGPLGLSDFLTDDYKAIKVISVHPKSDYLRQKEEENREKYPRYYRIPTPEEQRETDMKQADRTWRKIGRKAFEGLHMTPPKFLETNWRVFDRIQKNRASDSRWYKKPDAGDVITYRDETQKIVFVAQDSETKFA